MNKKVLYSLSALSILILVAAILVYRLIFSINIRPKTGHQSIYIPTGSSYPQVIDTLKSGLKVKNMKVLEWIAGMKNYPALVKPGRYVIGKGLSYNELINILRSGRQTPVKLTFNNIRTLNQLAGKIGSKLEADSSEVMDFFNNDSNFSSDGFKKENIIALFIPDTYELYWTTTVQILYKRMLKEYRQFWNKQRLAKAAEKELTPLDVAILASIIDDEVVKREEKPRIAGVYLNRLKRGMPLQACPTIKFALNDFTITRVLYKDLQTESLYNTYRYSGLPPGPIGCPSADGIDAVLNAEDHDYLFFAAKADFSGYHNFSRTLSEHNRYAAMYQYELDRRKIFR